MVHSALRQGALAAVGAPPSLPRTPRLAAGDLACLHDLHDKVRWLSAWTIHHANHLREHRDGLKVGGHQASSASLATVMTALWFSVLQPEDRVAVKPHASPVFHAIQYLLGRQSREQLERFRAFGGAQSYPSRTKDRDEVDFSTGSVGLGVAVTLFASLVQDLLLARDLLPAARAGRMIALLGDAELDEGNVWEALIEGCKHDLRNCWWIIDYNRQSLDAITTDRMFGRFADLFGTAGWQVVTIKYGRRQQAAFAEPGGEALREWIDECPNSLYSALTFKGGAAWREHLLADKGAVPGFSALLDRYDDDALHALMVNLGGHDLECLLDAFHGVDDEQPRCFIAYTIKGFGLPFQGHKDNHAGLMSPEQMATFRALMGVAEGAEWEPFAGMEARREQLLDYLQRVPIAARVHATAQVPVLQVPPAASFAVPGAGAQSTQVAFGRILHQLGRGDSELAARIVTTSPDVTVSTNLGGWVNQRGLFARRPAEDVFRAEHVASPQQWAASPAGQHLELGIAENNLFLALAALGLAAPLFGQRLIPIGTLYDPFISRGLDALNYACYQDARFILVATPSGITLAPEGGAHQSSYTPLIGMGQPGLTSFEPAYVDELAEILRFAFTHVQAPEGSSVYLRLSTRPLQQPTRTIDDSWRRALLHGAYWQQPPAPGARLVIAYAGVVATEALAAWERLVQRHPGAGLLAVPSPDRLHEGWARTVRDRAGIRARVRCHAERLLAPLAADAAIVTVIDGAPEALSWLGSVRGMRVAPLGVDRFGQCGDIPALYAEYGLDTDAIVAAGEALM